jgi:amidophosphoribosyltransferase
MIEEIEGTMNPDPEILNQYLDPTTDQHHQMIEKIREHIGVASLRYQRLGDMINAIGLPEEKLCTYCWNGRKAEK